MNFHGAGNNALSCLSMRCTSFVSCFAHRGDKSVRPSEGGFEGIEKFLAAVGLGGAAQPTPARRGMLSRDLFESPNGAQSRRISTANGQKCITPPPEALVHEKSMAEGDKNASVKDLPYPFPAFDPRDSNEQKQIRFRLLPSYRKSVHAPMTMRKR
jgi:hypothetical protein